MRYRCNGPPSFEHQPTSTVGSEVIQGLGLLNRFATAIAIVALVLAGAAGLWFGRPKQAAAPPSITEVTETAAQRLLTVHVSGAVAHPGLVRVTAPARVADVVLAAGGALPDAVLAAVNLAASVADGQHIQIPSTSLEPGSGAVRSGKVAINQADVAQLETLPGVGPVLAQRIFDYREANGPFARVEDLLDVPGIGESKLAVLRDEITVP